MSDIFAEYAQTLSTGWFELALKLPDSLLLFKLLLLPDGKLRLTRGRGNQITVWTLELSE